MRLGLAVADPSDPLETINRQIFLINEHLDKHVVAPVARTYQRLLPSSVRDGIGNFFSNTQDLLSSGYLVLQGRPVPAVAELTRFALNTTIGIFGIIDVSTRLGLERRRESIGSTLNAWGVGTGAYVVWPILGPSTLRDSLDFPVAFYTSPQSFMQSQSIQNSLTALEFIDARAGLLGATSIIDEIAFDKYLFIRDAYFQRNKGDGKIEDPSEN